MDDQDNNKTLEVLANPELAAAYARVTTKKYLNALKERSAQKPKAISGMTSYERAALTRTRRWLFKVAVGLSVFSLVNAFISFPGSVYYALIAPFTAFAFLLVVFREVVTGAGAEIQTEYQHGETFYREYKFNPSITLDSLLLFVAVGFAAIVLGFADMYAALSKSNPTEHFSSSITGISSIYFAVVTFATVGYGDLYPISPLAKVVVATEILLSFCLITIVITTTVSWVTGTQQRLHEELIRSRSKETLEREEIMKLAGIGVYGNHEELLAEARAELQKER